MSLTTRGNHRETPTKAMRKKERTLNKLVEFVKLFHQQSLLNLEKRPDSMQEDALLHTRTCPSRDKKTPFLKQERPFL